MKKQEYMNIAQGLAARNPSTSTRFGACTTMRQQEKYSAALSQWNLDCEITATMIKKTSPGFDRKAFLQACVDEG